MITISVGDTAQDELAVPSRRFPGTAAPVPLPACCAATIAVRPRSSPRSTPAITLATDHLQCLPIWFCPLFPSPIIYNILADRVGHTTIFPRLKVLQPLYASDQ